MFHRRSRPIKHNKSTSTGAVNAEKYGRCGELSGSDLTYPHMWSSSSVSITLFSLLERPKVDSGTTSVQETLRCRELSR